MSLNEIRSGATVRTTTRGNVTATLYLGDCREILPTLGEVDAVITDPPYGINLGDHEGATDKRNGILIKERAYCDTEENFSSVVVPGIRMSLDQSDRGMVFGVPPSMWQFPAPTAIGGIFCIAAVGRNKWGWSNFIHCLLYGTAPELEKGAKQTGVSRQACAERTGHPVTKPLIWMRWAVDLGSSKGQTIIDPFMGSGTTGVAAMQLGRNFIGIEIEPKYFQIACDRIEAEARQGVFDLATC